MLHNTFGDNAWGRVSETREPGAIDEENVGVLPDGRFAWMVWVLSQCGYYERVVVSFWWQAFLFAYPTLYMAIGAIFRPLIKGAARILKSVNMLVGKVENQSREGAEYLTKFSSDFDQHLSGEEQGDQGVDAGDGHGQDGPDEALTSQTTQCPYRR